MASGGHGSLLLIGGAAALAYFTRASWLPQAETTLGISGGSGAAGTNPTAPTTTPANQPITGAIPGATPVYGGVPVANAPEGTPIGNGCYQFGGGTSGISAFISCPPGVTPPATAIPGQGSSCADGFTMDVAGICTRYSDSYLLANLNSIAWTGLSDIPSEQINRIDPQILQMYATTTGVNAGTALAYLLGLGANPADGTIMNGSDGYAYKALNGVFYRQGTSTHTTVNGVPTGRLGSVTRALPITENMLILASSDPITAAVVGRDQRAMLTAAQWNRYYTMATGIAQGIPLHPENMRGALMSAQQYQARRKAAGLQTVTNLGCLGTLRPARRGAFPLGRLGEINHWIPPGNRTIYQIPGRGAVPAGKGGRIPPPRLGLIFDGGGDHRWARSPFPRQSWWREASGNPAL